MYKFKAPTKMVKKMEDSSYRNRIKMDRLSATAVNSNKTHKTHTQSRIPTDFDYFPYINFIVIFKFIIKLLFNLIF